VAVEPKPLLKHPLLQPMGFGFLEDDDDIPEQPKKKRAILPQDFTTTDEEDTMLSAQETEESDFETTFLTDKESEFVPKRPLKRIPLANSIAARRPRRKQKWTAKMAAHQNTLND
jgi:hypothetical protein